MLSEFGLGVLVFGFSMVWVGRDLCLVSWYEGGRVMMVSDGVEVQDQKISRSECWECVGAEDGGLNREDDGHQRAVQSQVVVFLVVASGCCSLFIFSLP